MGVVLYVTNPCSHLFTPVSSVILLTSGKLLLRLFLSGGGGERQSHISPCLDYGIPNTCSITPQLIINYCLPSHYGHTALKLAIIWSSAMCDCTDPTTGSCFSATLMMSIGPDHTTMPGTWSSTPSSHTYLVEKSGQTTPMLESPPIGIFTKSLKCLVDSRMPVALVTIRPT